MKNLSVKSKLILAFLLSTTMLLVTCFIAFSVQRQTKSNLYNTFEKNIPKIIFVQDILTSIYQYSQKVEQILRIDNRKDFINARNELEDYYTNFKNEFEKFVKDNPKDNFQEFSTKFEQVSNNNQTKINLRLSQIENKRIINQKWKLAQNLVQDLIDYIEKLEFNMAKNLKKAFLPIQKLEKKLSHNQTFENLMTKSKVLHDVILEMQGVADTTHVFSYRNKFSMNHENILIELNLLKDKDNYLVFKKSKDIIDLYSENDNVFKLTARYIELTKTLSKLNETREAYNSELYNLVEDKIKVYRQNLSKKKRQLFISTNTSLTLLVISGVLFLIASALIFHYIIQRDILTRLKKLSEVTLELAKGNHSIEIQTEGHDEITEMADAAFIFKENLVELEASNAKLEDAYEELQQFAYRTSHDLKAPLVTIQGLTRIIKSEISESNNETVEECIQRIENLSGQLSTLIEDILNLAKSDHEQQNEKVIDVQTYLKNALEKFSGLNENHPIEVKVKWDHSFLICQPIRFLQVFENLISNAYKYVDTKKSHSFISIKTYEEGKYFILEVEDNGLGIPQENRSKLFKMFNRFHKTSFGSGLGLYLTKKHVDRMKGEISYKEQNGNTVFMVKLPLKKVASHSILREID